MVSRRTQKAKEGHPKGPETLAEAVDKAVRRSCGPKDAEYMRGMLVELVKNHSIPVELLEHIPVRAKEAGKTRFDQLYDACMHLIFPGYKRDTIEMLLGYLPSGSGTKIWRVVIPPRFGITHVLLRAPTYQEAFALACDYACRASVRLYQKIPSDLTLRVMFMSEKALRRFLKIRWSNRERFRKRFQIGGGELTPRQVYGARFAALGKESEPRYSIARYAEAKDLKAILAEGVVRSSAVESESPRK